MYLYSSQPQLSPSNKPRLDICTAGLYWSMIESGLGICAACLPSQYGIFSTTGLQSIVRSVQSVISLRSIRSASQNASPVGSNNLPTKTEAWTSDTQHITAYAEGPANDDMELGSGVGRGGIVVTNSFESRQELAPSMPIPNKALS